MVDERECVSVVDGPLDCVRAKLCGGPGHDSVPGRVFKRWQATVLDTRVVVERGTTGNARVWAVGSEGEWEPHVAGKDHVEAVVEVAHGAHGDEGKAERTVTVAHPHEHDGKEGHGQSGNEGELKHRAEEEPDTEVYSGDNETGGERHVPLGAGLDCLVVAGCSAENLRRHGGEEVI